jgi:hypothetical protein
MKKINLQFEGISENLKYIFTNKGMIHTSSFFSNNEDKFINYSYETLPIAVDILKEHKEIYYKLDKISLTEYANSSRKFLYQLMEIFQPENQITILKEWEDAFGSKLIMLNESVDKLLIESRINDSWDSIKYILIEADWYNPLSWDLKGAGEKAGKWVGDQAKGVADWTKEQGKQISQKGLVGWASDKSKSVWNTVKNAVSKAWTCLSNNFFECLMEGIRSAAFSALGIGAMTLVTFIPGVGQIADSIVYGSLLIWDVYKMLSGKYESGQYQWSFIDIIIDAVCILLPALGAGAKAAMRGIKTAEQLGVAAATKGGIFAKILNLLKGSLSKVIGVIGKAAEWVGEKLGLIWLKNFGVKAQSFMTKTVESSIKVAESNGMKVAAGTEKKSLVTKVKDFKFTKPTPVVIKSTGKTIMVTALLCSALGLEGWTCQHKIENGEISEEQLALAMGSKEQTLDKLNQLSDDQIKELNLF